VINEVLGGETFTVTFEGKDQYGREEEKKKELAKDTEGTVLEFNTEGDTKIVSEKGWVLKDQFCCLFPLPNVRHMPIHQ